MTKEILKSVTILGAIGLVAVLGLTVLATGEPEGDGKSDGKSGILHHLHQMGHHLHHLHGGHHRNPMAELIDDLELDAEQREHLEAIHHILGAFGSPGHGSMTEIHEQLIERFEAGSMDRGEVRSLVDDHLEEIRVLLHGAADEMVVLVNSLDESQRQVLSEHLENHDHGRGR